jgi:hypothetical protein
MTVLLGVEKQKNIQLGVRRTRKDRKITGSQDDKVEGSAYLSSGYEGWTAPRSASEGIAQAEAGYPGSA